MKLKTKFQDEDFDLGEVVEANFYYSGSGRVKIVAEPAKGGTITLYFDTLKEMNEMFEDYEEPKKYWYITGEGDICRDDVKCSEWIEERKSIGNHFETKEEAETAVEKLKAWKRLKDKGFKFKDYTRKFDGFKRVDGSVFIVAELDDEGVIGMIDDLNICFGGEE